MLAAGITGAALKGGLEIIAKIRAGRDVKILARSRKYSVPDFVAKPKSVST